MPLLGKIVTLFIGLTIVPALIFMSAARRETLIAVDRVTQARLEDDVAAVARSLAREHGRVENLLGSISAFVSSDSSGTLDAVSALVEGARWAGGGLEYVELRDTAGRILFRTGEVPESSSRCGPWGRSTLVEARAEAEATAWVGAYWIGDALDPSEARRSAAIDADGRLLLSPECGEAPEWLEVAPAPGTPGSFRFGAGSDTIHGASVPVSGTSWTAIVTTPGILRGPIARLFRNAWWFVLGLGGLATLGLALLLGRVTRSLADLTRAADRVADGDFRPWLPPPREDEIGRLTLSLSRMMDELRSHFDRVDRNGRLAVMGELSSYLAHEIRNPLSGVKMNLQRLRRWQGEGLLPERCREPVEMSLSEVERLSKTVSSVLQLGRAPNDPPEVVSLHALVTEAGQLLENEFARCGVDLRCKLDADGDRIVGRAGQIKGAIINLMLNAVEAQPEGGELLIRSALVSPAKGARGPSVELHFVDRGPGVPPEIRDRILHPFFTTKQQGSGIGLAVASQGIRENGGDLRLEETARIDHGACFVMSFPLAPLFTEVDASPVASLLPTWMERAEPAEPKDPAGQGES